MYTVTGEVTNMSQEQEEKHQTEAFFLNTQRKYLNNKTKNDVSRLK